MKYIHVPVFTGSNQEDFLQQISRFMREIVGALQFLDLASSYSDCFISDEVTIGAGSEISIPNKRPNLKMKYMIPVSEDTVDSNIKKGAAGWTKKTLYVKNTGSASVTAKILFFV